MAKGMFPKLASFGSFRMDTYKIIVMKGRKSYYWKLKRKGRIIAHSEQYSSHSKALKTATALLSKIECGWCELIDLKSK